MPHLSTPAARQIWEMGVRAGWDACMRAKAKLPRQRGGGEVVDLTPLLRADPVTEVDKWEGSGT